jgi:hypothetical protein
MHDVRLQLYKTKIIICKCKLSIMIQTKIETAVKCTILKYGRQNFQPYAYPSNVTQISSLSSLASFSATSISISNLPYKAAFSSLLFSSSAPSASNHFSRKSSKMLPSLVLPTVSGAFGHVVRK